MALTDKMPIHDDWRSLYDGLMEQYCDGTGEDTQPKGGPCRRGKQVFYAYCEQHGIDYTQPRPEAMEAFQWVGDLTPEEREGRYFVKGRAIHPCRTHHPDEWPEVRVYLEEELKASAPSLSGKPLTLDHGIELDPPNRVLRSAWEDGSVEYVAEVSRDIYEAVKRGEIRHVSVEYDWRILEKLDGVAPRGLQLTGLSLLRRMRPGDPQASVEAWEGVVRKLKEMKDVSRPALEERVRRLEESVRMLRGQEDRRERLHTEQEERARRYGISPKPGGSPTKPADFENVPEDQFADPVNYRYPVDAEHVMAALAYFNQPKNRGDYSHDERVKILARIVEAARACGVEVSYQPEDPVYRDLPEDLKAKLKGYGKKATEAEALRVELAEARRTIMDLAKERDALKARTSLGEAVVAPASSQGAPQGYVRADEVLAILPKDVPWRWGAGPHELVRRLRAKCSQSIRDQPRGR